MLRRILQILKLRKLDLHAQALREGRLVDMQLPPYKEFNELLNCNFPLTMTKAAFEHFVWLPGEPKKKAVVPANFRWSTVFLTLIAHEKEKPINENEAIFDVNVLLPNGFTIWRTLKVVRDGEEEDDGLTFMLPDECNPLSRGKEK